MAKKAVGTPATVLLTAAKVAFALHPYEVSADAPNYGALVAQALGVAPEVVDFLARRFIVPDWAG